MQKNELMKRLLVIFAVLALVLGLFPAFALAQEGGEGAEETTTEEVAGDDHSEGEEEHSEEGGGLSALGINMGFLIGQIVNISLLTALLGTLLWRPAVNMLDSRSATIQKGLEDAAAAARARQNAEAEADKILAEARAERQKVIEEARQQGEEVKKGIESEARQEAERIRTEAQQDARTARDAELSSLRDQVIKISTAVASRVLQEELSEDKQRALVSDFFSNVPAGAQDLAGTVEVISAMPLTDDEKSKVESAVKADAYEYTVDPAILGGIILRAEDRVVDGSVRGNLGNLSGNLK